MSLQGYMVYGCGAAELLGGWMIIRWELKQNQRFGLAKAVPSPTLGLPIAPNSAEKLLSS